MDYRKLEIFIAAEMLEISDRIRREFPLLSQIEISIIFTKLLAAAVLIGCKGDVEKAREGLICAFKDGMELGERAFMDIEK